MGVKMTSQREKKALISRLLGSDPRITGFLFESPEESVLRDRPERLLQDIWELESEDRVLVRAALDIWSGSGQVFLAELLDLNEPAFSRLLTAIQQARRPGPPS